MELPADFIPLKVEITNGQFIQIAKRIRRVTFEEIYEICDELISPENCEIVTVEKEPLSSLGLDFEDEKKGEGKEKRISYRKITYKMFCDLLDAKEEKARKEWKRRERETDINEDESNKVPEDVLGISKEITRKYWFFRKQFEREEI